VGTLSDIGSFILAPLYYVISLVLVGWHELWTLVGFDPEGGMSWVLSIIGLTLVIRAALIPLFVKQIKSSRNMQLIQPKVKELQKKYGHDRERLAQETMKLYKESGTNPFASCLPILLQMPIFLALFRLIDHASDGDGRGILSDERAQAFGASKIFGVIPIKDTLLRPEGHVSVQVLALVLVLAMTATTFLTQRQLMSKNMPADALSGQYAQQQKMLLYVLPVVFAVGGIAFPIGVLLYWTTSNLWTMGQQFYVIRNNPAPGTPAFAAKEKRDREKGKGGPASPEDGDSGRGVRLDKNGGGGSGSGAATPTTSAADRRPAQRQQPKKQTRQQRRSGCAGGPGGQR